jgi:hypothetical protein
MFWSRKFRGLFAACRSNAAIIAMFALAVLVVLSHELPFQRPSSQNHKRSDVLCGAASWEDVVAFYLLNYIAHGATIRHFPGDSTKTQIWWTACALFFPFAGV